MDEELKAAAERREQPQRIDHAYPVFTHDHQIWRRSMTIQAVSKLEQEALAALKRFDECDPVNQTSRPDRWAKAASSCIAYVRALSSQAPDPWQPIAEAPRDGTHIILAFGQDHACEGWYEDDDNQPRPWAFIDIGDFNEVVINHARDGEYGPSHWQPMPYREPRTRAMPPSTTGGTDGR